MTRKITLAAYLIIFSMLSSFATPPDEGMWLPLLVKRLNHTDMKKMGLKLTADEIYSINNSSLKDAIVMLGGGFCTAEVVSKEGLVLTNHHCGYNAIQSHSTVEHDYLTDGFWAMKKEDELPNEGLTASFLVRMEDVTQKVLSELNDEMSEQDRNAKVAEISGKIKEEAEKGGGYNAAVKSFFDGNEYYLFVYETYKDVRLVGAPPESVGKFGGDTDNWMWPRHTGDFSMFRIYMGKDGKPSEYAADNVPYKPKHHLPVSLEGVRKNDFTMVMGFPGSTDRYLTSYGIQLILEETHPLRIAVREKRLALLKERMDADKAIRIKYASKYASVSNYWKYFIGQSKGLKKLKVFDKKRAEENKFENWVKADASRTKKYGKTIDHIKEGFEKMKEVNKSYYYLVESAYGTEILPFAFQFSQLVGALSVEDPKKAGLDGIVEGLKKQAEGHFKDYDKDIDQKVVGALLKMYFDGVDKSLHPDVFNQVTTDFNGDFDAFAKNMFEKSVFVSSEKLNKFLGNPDKSVLQNDPAFIAMGSIMANYFQNISPKRKAAQEALNKGNRLFVDGLRKMNPDKKYAPNANSTLRLTYGQVLDYFPQDAVFYSYYTTTSGILEKEDPKNPEFVVPEKLKTLLKAKDFGRFSDNGKLVVAFITNNDITGGNSGSPVMNGEGELIGLAFDGNWEAMSGDIAFETELQRCINVDIRYVLFIIEKLGGAKHLVDEMTLVQGKTRKGGNFKQKMPAKY